MTSPQQRRPLPLGPKVGSASRGGGNAAQAREQALSDNSFVRTVGIRVNRPLQDAPSGAGLEACAQLTEAISAFARCGFPKGVYRYRSHEEANRHEAHCLALQMAALSRPSD